MSETGGEGWMFIAVEKQQYEYIRRKPSMQNVVAKEVTTQELQSSKKSMLSEALSKSKSR